MIIILANPFDMMADTQERREQTVKTTKNLSRRLCHGFKGDRRPLLTGYDYFYSEFRPTDCKRLNDTTSTHSFGLRVLVARSQ